MVDALARYSLQPEERARFVPLFGLLLSTLYDLDVTSDTAISEWLEAAEASPDEGVAALLSQKWTRWLIERLDEGEDEEEDEDGEDKDEDGEDEDEDGEEDTDEVST